MIISRTPLRISLCSSGGSDLPAFYLHGIPGMSLTAAITRYMYITVNPKFDNRTHLCYSRTEDVELSEELEHDLARECLSLLGIQKGIEIHSCSDIPSGTGLGSSSAFTVGLLKALIRSLGKSPPPNDILAQLACDVEIDRCHHPIGKQDQFASALGGVRLLKFEVDGSVETSAMVDNGRLQEFRNQLLLFWTGLRRNANDVLQVQSEKMADSEYRESVFQIAARSIGFAKSLSFGDWRMCGEILDEVWQMKKDLSEGISNDLVDGWYKTAKREGAEGGKICGAGGGGFLLIMAPPDRHRRIQEALQLKSLSFDFDFEGSTIIYQS